MPNKSSDARLIEKMQEAKKSFSYGEKTIFHSSGFFFASEASDSFQEVFGDITTTITSLYDCNPVWQKSTKKDGDITIVNTCFNLLAACTVQFLGTLIGNKDVMGGFASRIVYVKGEPRAPVRREFPLEMSREVRDLKQDYIESLIHDLKRINEMVGPFKAEKEFAEAWSDWDLKMQETSNSTTSDTMKSLIVRSGTLLLKLCMILSASESSDRVMKLRHFLKAKALIEEVHEELAGIFLDSRANNVASVDGLKSAFFSVFKESRTKPRRLVTSVLALKGHEPRKISAFIGTMIETGNVVSRGENLELLINPNDHL